MKVKQIPDLVVDYNCNSPENYVTVLNTISEKMGSCVKNLGAFADISAVELTSEMMVSFKDVYVTTVTTDHECPGSHPEQPDDAVEPKEIELEVLLADRDANDERVKYALSNEGLPKGKHTILGFSVTVNSCDPQEDCPECNGSGACAKCSGSGETQCGRCEGSGDCRKCHGSGVIICPRCKGGGYLKSGKCGNCNGEGTVGCPDCKRFLFGSNGKCSKCGGTGTVECTKCAGDGKCTNCKGTGRVVCQRCAGSGNYTAFTVCSADTASYDGTFFSTEKLKEAHAKLENNEDSVFSGPVRKWKRYNRVEFDCLDEICETIGKSFPHSVEAGKMLKEAYKTHLQGLKKDAEGFHYTSDMKVTTVPAATIHYQVNGDNYSLCVLGNTHVVVTDRLPKTVKEFKKSLFQRIGNVFTRKRRHMAFLKLAAYIFQQDGLTASESQTLLSFVDALTKRDSKKKKLLARLERFNAKMPYEQFRGEIKKLLHSKKVLTFAWQCMAVDKGISQGDLELFDKLCKDLKVSDELEIEALKRYATKFTHLDSATLVKEYLR